MAGDIKGITIEFGGDTQKLRTAINQVNQDVKATQQTLNEVNKALKFDPKNTELLAEKQKLLGEQISNNKKRIKDFEDIQAQLKSQGVEESSREYRNLAMQIANAKGELERTTEAQKKLNFELSLAGKASEKFNQMGNATVDLGNKLTGLSATAGAALVSLGGMAVKGGEYADNILTASKITHLTTEEIQRMSYASELLDVSQETVFASLKKLTKAMGDAADGGKTQVEAFEKLGISIKDSNGDLKTSKQVFDETIDALGKVENSVERDALAMDLFGKSATDLNPLIEEGSQAFNELSASAGNIIADEDLNKMGEFDDAIQKIKADGEGAFNKLAGTIAVDLLPVVESISKAINEFSNSFAGLSPEVRQMILVILAVVAAIAPVLIIFGKLAVAISNILKIVPIIAKVFGMIGGAISAPVIAIAALIAAFAYAAITSQDFRDRIVNIFNGLKTVFIGIVDFFKNVVTGNFEGALNSLNTIVAGAFQTFVNLFLAPLEMLKAVLGDLLGFVGNMFGVDLKTPFTAFIDFINAIFVNQFLTGFTTIKNIAWDIFNTYVSVFENIKGVFNGVIEFVTGLFSANWAQAWQGIVTIFENIVNGIANLIKGPINAMIDLINGFLSGVNQIKLPKVFGGGGINIPLIPKLAIGTDKVLQDGLAYLHKGEQVVPSKVVSGGYTGENISSAILEALQNAEFYINTNIDIDGREVAERVSYIQGMQLKKAGV